MDHSKCSYSEGIHDGITVGQGNLDKHGYWEFPCYECARKVEQKHPEYYPVWPFSDEYLNQMIQERNLDTIKRKVNNGT